MAVSAASALNVTGSDTDATSYATASWTPTTGKVYVVGFAHRQSAGFATAAAISGNNISWTAINEAVSGTSMRLRAWVGYADGTQTTGAITFSNLVSVGNADSGVWGIAELTAVTSTGTVVQSGTGSTSTDSVLVTLAAFASTANATGAWVLSYDGGSTTGPAITAGTGFSIVSGLDASQASNSEGVRLAFEFLNTNDTGVDATAVAANDQLLMVAFEIAAGAGFVYRPRDILTAALRRASYW